jgi:myo-inositol-1(or 4)-monophosphatase
MATDVDVSIENAVREFLDRESPDINFLGEERGLSGKSEDKLMWVLDPIDGTANFLHRLPLCAVSLGLIDGARTILGVISLPFLDSLYYATEGRGAFLDGTLITTSRTSSLHAAIVSVGDYEVGEDAEERNRTAFAITQALATHVQRIRMFGSAATDLAWVAEGKLDAAVILANEPWDTSAGVLIAREAGAMVLGRDGSSHTLESTATIALTPSLAATLLPLLKHVLDGKS